MITKLPDGRKAIVLDDKVEAAYLVTVGDTDGDGAVGLRQIGLVDIPFDGEDAPRQVFDSSEQFESLNPFDLIESLGGVVKQVTGLIKKVGLKR